MIILSFFVKIANIFHRQTKKGLSPFYQGKKKKREIFFVSVGSISIKTSNFFSQMTLHTITTE